MMNRRGFLFGAGATIAVVAAPNLMKLYVPASGLILPGTGNVIIPPEVFVREAFAIFQIAVGDIITIGSGFYGDATYRVTATSGPDRIEIEP